MVPINVVKIFRKYDEDDGGTIDFEEFENAVTDMKIGLPEAPEIRHKIYETYGGDEVGMELLQFDSLISAMAKFRSVEEPFVHDSIFGKGKPFPKQKEVRAFYLRPLCVWSVAFVICANFVVNILEKEIDADLAAPRYTSTWEALDLGFNIIFLFELLLNMYGYGGPVRAFWSVGWNVFDFIIVVLAFITNIPGLPSALARLKLLRAFRVFRLFKRIKSLNKIIMSLLQAIPGTTNAFVVLFIFFCIYAILAVELFREFGLDGEYTTGGPLAPNGTVSSETQRGFANGREYYGTYSKAMYTLFQVFTGDSWSEAIARPLLFGMYDDSVVVGIFYVSFVILTQLVLMNVIMAVLLDKFVSDEKGDDDGTMSEEKAKEFLEFSGIDSKVLPAFSPPVSLGDRKSRRASCMQASTSALAAAADNMTSESSQVKRSLGDFGERVERVEQSMQRLTGSVREMDGKLTSLISLLSDEIGRGRQAHTIDGNGLGGAAQAVTSPRLSDGKERQVLIA